MKTTLYSRLLPAGIALTLLTGALAGCGGGGSASVARPADVTVTGTLLDSSSAPLSGYTVVYNSGGAQPAARISAHATTAVLSAVTDSKGSYTLVVPTSKITGSDTLSFYDTTGALAQTQSLALSATQTGTVTVPQNVVTTLPSPPDPPSSSL
jgi:hypothetical protein